ncbi:MAG: universal stress protein [Hyphomicrobium sp.]|nr:universal stress protein [Hyphomicrobium sp.]
MSHKILCAVDGSAHSDRAVQLAAQMARAMGADLFVCTVNVALLSGRAGASYVHAEEEMERILAKAAGVAKTEGVTVTRQAVISARDVAAGVVDHAERNNCDIIVVGTGDRRAISKLILGSAAEEIARRAHCTVVIAR